MKTLKFAALALTAAAPLLFTACDKEDDDAQPTKTDLLTRAEWKGSDVFFDGVSHKDSAWVDITSFRLKFEKNGTYIISDLDGDTDTVDWNFINNESQIVIGGDTNTISVLTMDNLNLVSAEQRPANVPAEYEIRLVH